MPAVWEKGGDAGQNFGNAATLAGQGAAAGGAAFGPLGALGGGVIGGIAGLLGLDLGGGGGGSGQQLTPEQLKEQVKQMRLKELQGMLTSLQQNSGVNRIAGGLESGTGAAQTLMQQGIDTASKNVYGDAISMRGVSSLQAAKIANRGTAEIRTAGAQQGSLLRLQELMAAANLYGQNEGALRDAVLEQIRGEYGLQGARISAAAAADAANKELAAKSIAAGTEALGKVGAAAAGTV